MKAAKPPTVLVVDDDELIRRMLRRLLARGGYAVTCADSGGAAIDLLVSSSDIDIVILDYMMPAMRGDQALAKLREVNGDLPVVMLSGTMEARDKQRLLENGACFCLEKPVDFKVLSAAICGALGRSKSSAIAAFEQDEHGDWIAHLTCGHRQHMRHNPPLVTRPWVLTPAGRAAKIGEPIDCGSCAKAT